MTVSTIGAVDAFTGDGSTTEFATTFVFNTSADIEVIERVIATGAETTKTLTTDYTVSGGGGATGTPATGTVTAVSAPAATVEWHIRRIVAETQDTNVDGSGSFNSAGTNLQLDRIVLQIQQHTEELSRALQFPKTDSSSLSAVLDNSVDRASMYLKFTSTGALTVASGDPIDSGFANGSAAAPSMFFTNDDDSGFYRVGANDVGFAAGGSKIFEYDANGVIIAAGSAAAPSLSFDGDRDTGLYASAANQVAVTVRGFRVAEFVDGGNTIVNYLQITGREANQPVKLAAAGSDTNIDLELTPKAAGLVRVGNSSSWVANGSATITISNVGPAGIGTATIAKWLNVKDDSGNDFYIPVWT